ncbi:MAG: hypothetical protein LC725_05705 [Lentisphaerae bacterium]|nr:hypothetical protein [Lentisphaerota bacterium]
MVIIRYEFEEMEYTVSPTLLNNTVYAGSDATSQEFDIIKTSGKAFDYVVTTNTPADWLQVTPGNGSFTDAHGASTITINYNTTALAVGIHTAYLVVATADWGGATQTVEVVMTVQRKTQTITDFLPSDGARFLKDEIVELRATASSGLPVSFDVVSGPGLITGLTNLSFTGTGEVKVTAAQSGDALWEAAPTLTNIYHAYHIEIQILSAAQINNGSGQVYIENLLENTALADVDATLVYGPAADGPAGAINLAWLSEAQAGYGAVTLANGTDWQARGVSTASQTNLLYMTWATQDAGNDWPLAGLDTELLIGVRIRDAISLEESVRDWTTLRVDNRPPEVIVSSPTSDPTAQSPIPVRVEFDEDVTGFSFAGIIAHNALKTGWVQESARVYRFDLVPVYSQCVVRVELVAGAAQDAFGNPSRPGALAREYRIMPSEGLRASSGLRRVVRLDWQAGAGVEHYEVWRATDGAPELIGISSSTNYLDRAVQVGVDYFYRLREVNPSGTSEWSEGAWGWCRAARDDFTGNGFWRRVTMTATG